MGLTFLQPAFLLGALAAAVPVIIHLIYRRRALVHRFPAVRFLLLADKRTARKFRLAQWLLLALRMLAICLLAFSLARPHLTGSNVQAAALAPPQATVFLVDNSLSMQYRDGQETRLQRAKTLTSRLVQSLALNDSAVVLPLLMPEEAADANVLITDVRITEKPFIEHAPLDVTAVVQNRSATALRNVRVDLFLGSNAVGQQLVDLGPDEQLTVPFRIAAPPAGLHWGEVRLEGDGFAEDDRFYYALRTVTPVHVLLVDGDPGTSLFDSEIFYLLQALQPRGVLGRPLFYPKPVPWEGLEQERLSDYQVIALCNVEALTAQVRQRLYQFVVEGGGLLFFAGNRVDPVRYNAMFYRSDTLLLPLALGQPTQRQQEQPMTIGTVHSTHEALAAFAGEETMLQRGKFYRYLTMEGLNTVPGVRMLLAFQDGRPLLVD